VKSCHAGAGGTTKSAKHTKDEDGRTIGAEQWLALSTGPARTDRNFGFLSEFNLANGQRKLAGGPALAWYLTRKIQESLMKPARNDSFDCVAAWLSRQLENHTTVKS
jgi:hypothetical protein